MIRNAKFLMLLLAQDSYNSQSNKYQIDETKIVINKENIDNVKASGMNTAQEIIEKISKSGYKASITLSTAADSDIKVGLDMSSKNISSNKGFSNLKHSEVSFNIGAIFKSTSEDASDLVKHVCLLKNGNVGKNLDDITLNSYVIDYLNHLHPTRVVATARFIISENNTIAEKILERSYGERYTKSLMGYLTRIVNVHHQKTSTNSKQRGGMFYEYIFGANVNQSSIIDKIFANAKKPNDNSYKGSTFQLADEDYHKKSNDQALGAGKYFLDTDGNIKFLGGMKALISTRNIGLTSRLLEVLQLASYCTYTNKQFHVGLMLSGHAQIKNRYTTDSKSNINADILLFVTIVPLNKLQFEIRLNNDNVAQELARLNELYLLAQMDVIKTIKNKINVSVNFSQKMQKSDDNKKLTFSIKWEYKFAKAKDGVEVILKIQIGSQNFFAQNSTLNPFTNEFNNYDSEKDQHRCPEIKIFLTQSKKAYPILSNSSVSMTA
jgi:hypothetical protein